jgi:hypothetical protein
LGATLARIIGIPVEAARLQFERRDTRWQGIDAKVIADQPCPDVRVTFDAGFLA